MSVQLALGVVGGVIGGYFGYPQLGVFLGSLAGAALAPKQKIQGPKLDDLNAPRLQYGQSIPRIFGTVRASGTPIWSTDLLPRESTEDAGKGGGPSITTTTYVVDILLLLSIDTIKTPVAGLSRIWVNKKLVYSVAPGASADTIVNSGGTTAWTAFQLFDGNAAQLPWGNYEASVGIGLAPAYRDRTTLAIAELKLGTSGIVPLIEVELFTSGLPASAGYRDTFTDGLTPFTGDIGGAFFSTLSTEYGGAIQTLGQAPGPSGEITKPIPETDAYGFQVKFTTSGLGNDDCGILLLFDGASEKFAITPRREVTFDPQQRCAVFVDQSTAVFLGSAALDPFTFYEVQVDLIPGAGNSVARLYNLTAGGVLMDTQNFLSADWTFLTCDTLTINCQGSLGSGAAVFADLKLLGHEAVYGPVDLEDIVNAELERVLDPSRFDASDLSGITVAGYGTTQSPRGTLEELAGIYYFGAFCDTQLRIVRRGQATSGTLTYEETGAGVDEAEEPFNGMNSASELEVPAFYSIVTPDPTRDYEPQSIMSDRLVTQSKETRQVLSSVVLSPTEAKGRADSMARDSKVASYTWFASVGLKHIARTPTDIWTLTDVEGTTYRSRIMRSVFADWMFKNEGVLDDVNALAMAGIAPPDGESTVEVVDLGFTFLELVDGPILRDDDDDPGLYGATRTTGDTPAASRIMKSADGVTYTKVVDIPEQSLGGQASTELGDVSNPYVWDEVNTVTVTASAALSSSTKAAMSADRAINCGALRSGSGWEYFRWRTATLVSPGIYTLSGLVRGMRGTETFTGGHSVGDSFLVLRAAGIRRIPGNLADVGVPLYYKGLLIGGDDAPAIPFTNNAVGLKPYSPCRLRAARDTSGNITFTWTRRTRMVVRYGGVGGSVTPLGEGSEAYSLDIYDSGTVVRTLTSSVESVAYSAANQTTDFGGLVSAGNCDTEVFQISESIGRGYGFRKSV